MAKGNAVERLADSTLLIDLHKELRWRRKGHGNQPGAVEAFVIKHAPFAFSVVALSEFLEGAPDASLAGEILRQFGLPIQITRRHAEKTAQVQRRRAAKGKRLGENDAWHAGVALANGYQLVTREAHAFQGTPGLKLLPHPAPRLAASQ